MEEDIRDTLKANFFGNSAKRRLMRVPLPTPDGPETTRGRRKSGRGDMRDDGKSDRRAQPGDESSV
jgi:hypothetical protein